MKNKIKAIFDSMDAEADGEVSMNEMGEVLAKIGLELNAEQSTKLLATYCTAEWKCASWKPSPGAMPR